ncbi:3-isopropylmalate dehydratase large subunit [Streptomyces cucumeris]|uniref:3-isopropylmalate dehydratase large subunit n=1 Tax=Streptomyces cucumeris TaxID=2962890 RepID=UPI003D715060
MGQTMTAKILGRRAGRTDTRTGDVLLPSIDLMTCLDGTTFIDAFNNDDLKVWDPQRVIFCFDHGFQPDWMPVAAVTEHPKIRKFAREQGIPGENVYDYGRNGLSHQIPVEQGWALPGTICMGTDTQSSTMGAANCFAMPCMYGADAILLTGKVWMQVPECIQVNLTGSLPHGVNGKDVAYRLIRDLGDVVNGRVIEFAGPGLAGLSVDARMAICNGAVQVGALTMLFPADQVLTDYLDGRARGAFEPANADPDADYVARYDYDLSTFENLVAGPHEITLVRPVSDVEGLRIDAANIGSCASGRLSDLALAAEVLRGRRVHPDVRLFVTPISAETADQAERAGLFRVFLDAGATITQPGCGGCYSGNLSPLKLGDGERCVSTSVETLKGRMGSQEAEIYLASAAVTAASAIAGKIVEPAPYLQNMEATR